MFLFQKFSDKTVASLGKIFIHKYLTQQASPRRGKVVKLRLITPWSLLISRCPFKDQRVKTKGQRPKGKDKG